MAVPKGKRTVKKEAEQPTNLPSVELVCAVTGETFLGYQGQLPISKRGWSELTDAQKFQINQGVPLQEVLNR